VNGGTDSISNREIGLFFFFVRREEDCFRSIAGYLAVRCGVHSRDPAVKKSGSEEDLMDVRIFFQKVRQVEAAITTPHAVVVSLETPDGGKAGTMTEVSRIMASRLVVENKARLASDEETNEFYGRKPNARTPKA
jgi:hypothetical protein